MLDLAEALPAGDRDRLAALFDASCRRRHPALRDRSAGHGPPCTRPWQDAPGLIARRQAGAGFGGCLVALVERESVDAFAGHVGRTYADVTGIEPGIFGVEAAPGAGPIAI